MASIEDVLAGIRPVEQTVRVCLRGDLSAQIEELRGRWQDAASDNITGMAGPDAAVLYDQIALLEQESAESEQEFLLRAMGATAWRRLVAEHPPDGDDVDAWRWDLETFPPAALAASCVDPPMTVDQATTLADMLSNGQWGKLWGACLTVNVGEDVHPKRFWAATGGPRITGQRSTTAVPEGSLTASLLGHE